MSGSFVIDNSVVISWCFADEASRYADTVLHRLENEVAFVPAVWPLELGNVLLVAERRHRLTKADSARFLALIAALPITVEQETPDRMLKEVIALAREQKLSSYDASYLDLAMRKGISLATLDKTLLAAARRCRVPVFKR